MALNPVCPNCGFSSSEVRCPRCNALKVTGCSGSCFTCGSRPSCQKRVVDETVDYTKAAKKSTTPQKSVDEDGAAENQDPDADLPQWLRDM